MRKADAAEVADIIRRTLASIEAGELVAASGFVSRLEGGRAGPGGDRRPWPPAEGEAPNDTARADSEGPGLNPPGRRFSS